MNMNNITKIRNCLLLLVMVALLLPIGVAAKAQSTASETIKEKGNCNWSDDKIKQYFGIRVDESYI